MLLIPVELRESLIHGLGVFTVSLVKASSIVSRFLPPLDVQFSPELLAILSPTERTYISRYAYRSKFSGLFILPGDHDRFMNHSERPNVGMNPDGSLTCVALHDIRADEELTCDYRTFDADWELKLGGLMQVLTDYSQYYDGIFGADGPLFHRMAFTKGGLSKTDQFRLFQSLGLSAPPHGLVSALVTQHSESCRLLSVPPQSDQDVYCVVYLDELAHKGDGKVLLTLRDADARFPGSFASMFLPGFGQPVAYRYIRFGRATFWLRQTGRDPWRSNANESEQVIQKLAATQDSPVPRVLWAIDFVPTAYGLLAVDFNTAPDLTSLGEQCALSQDEIRSELEDVAKLRPNELLQF